MTAEARDNQQAAQAQASGETAAAKHANDAIAQHTIAGSTTATEPAVTADGHGVDCFGSGSNAAKPTLQPSRPPPVNKPGNHARPTPPRGRGRVPDGTTTPPPGPPLMAKPQYRASWQRVRLVVLERDGGSASSAFRVVWARRTRWITWWRLRMVGRGLKSRICGRRAGGAIRRWVGRGRGGLGVVRRGSGDRSERRGDTRSGNRCAFASHLPSDQGHAAMQGVGLISPACRVARGPVRTERCARRCLATLGVDGCLPGSL